MGLENSPSLDNLDSYKPEKKRLSQRDLRRGLLVAVLLLGTALLFLSGIRFGARADTAFGGLDGCLVNGQGNPVAAQVVFGDQSSQSYADGCFFFAALPAGAGELIVRQAGEEQLFPVEIVAGQALMLGDVLVK